MDPQEAEQWRRDLYRVSVDEYRFQVNVNWGRTQYLLAFNAALLAAGAALAPSSWAALVFGTGMVGSALGISVEVVQTGYYRAARDHMTASAALIGEDVEAFKLDTTPGMRDRSGFRWPRVRNAIYGMFAALAIADAAGALAVLLA